MQLLEESDPSRGGATLGLKITQIRELSSDTATADCCDQEL